MPVDVDHRSIGDHDAPLPSLATPKSGVRARPRVLFVDDDEATRELYAWSMKAAGWYVHTVSNGAEGLLAAQLLEPDAIVIELRLAVLDGLEAIRRIKSDAATKHVPIVACTGSDGRWTEIEARVAGCDEFVTKPCDPERLRELLEALVRRTIN